MLTKLEKIDEEENESHSEEESDLEQSQEQLKDKSCGPIVKGELYTWLVNSPIRNSFEL